MIQNIVVVAGSRAEFIEYTRFKYIKDNLAITQITLDRCLCLDASGHSKYFMYVTAPDHIRGIFVDEAEYIGTFYKLPNLLEIKKAISQQFRFQPRRANQCSRINQCSCIPCEPMVCTSRVPCCQMNPGYTLHSDIAFINTVAPDPEKISIAVKKEVKKILSDLCQSL